MGHVRLATCLKLYFEGRCLDNKLARRGKSKEKRSDCPLVTLALVVDARGFPVFSQIYEGNQAEPETLKDILVRLEKQAEKENLFQDLHPTIVMNRGIATSKNIELLKERQYPYVVVERRPAEKEYPKEFRQAKETFEPIANKGVYVKKVLAGDGCRVLCLSENRGQKETAMDALQEKRFLADLTRLSASVAKRSILLVAKVSERIGRIKERYPSIAQYYQIQMELSSDQKKASGLTWGKKTSRFERSVLTGCYCIETSHQDLDPRKSGSFT